MSTDTSRDEFEAWAARECMDIRRSDVDGRYLGEGRVDLFWRAWQASRSSNRASIRAEALEEAAKACDDGWHLLTRHECAEAIRALGETKEGQP